VDCVYACCEVWLSSRVRVASGDFGLKSQIFPCGSIWELVTKILEFQNPMREMRELVKQHRRFWENCENLVTSFPTNTNTVLAQCKHCVTGTAALFQLSCFLHCLKHCLTVRISTLFHIAQQINSCWETAFTLHIRVFQSSLPKQNAILLFPFLLYMVIITISRSRTVMW